MAKPPCPTLPSGSIHKGFRRQAVDREQVRELRHAAERIGWEVVGEFIDHGIAANARMGGATIDWYRSTL